jgi:hypothetical protein
MKEIEPNLVYVMMPFAAKGMDTVYAAIREECSKLSPHVTRSGENAGADIVINEIADRIQRAEFHMRDLTGERPNVYYELGYAHGAGNEALHMP